MKYPSGKTVTKQDRIEAVARLKEWLKDGDTLWFILRHRAKSGMQRVYDVKQIERHKDQSRPAVSTLSWNIALACNYSWSGTHGGVKVNGCGFSGEQDIADAVAHAIGLKSGQLRYETL